MSEVVEATYESKKWRGNGGNMAGSGAIYGLGLIGALIYYIHTASTFWWGLAGVVKAIFWPAVLIYKIFTMLHM